MSGDEFEAEKYKGIDEKRLDEILSNLSKVKAALIGDICLDIYWKADMTKSELSRETPHFPLPVVEEWMSPGAGGNAAANIASLKPAGIYLIGVVGKDWRGEALIQELDRRNIDTGGIITGSKWITNAYCKPYRRGISDVEYEDPRIDFSNYQPLCREDEEKLVRLLEQTAGQLDVLCVSDQMQYGCITPTVRNKIIALAKQGLLVVADSRSRIGLYTDVVLKPNEIEGYRAVYTEGDPRKTTFKEQLSAAKTLADRNNARVCMTLGSNGCIYAGEGTTVHVPSYCVKPPIDICGAGDTFLSAFSCALAVGARGYEAASFANIASDVTIKKIGITGTASSEEIKARHGEIFSALYATK